MCLYLEKISLKTKLWRYSCFEYCLCNCWLLQVDDLLISGFLIYAVIDVQYGQKVIDFFRYVQGNSRINCFQNLEIGDGSNSEDRVVHSTTVCDDLQKKKNKNKLSYLKKRKEKERKNELMWGLQTDVGCVLTYLPYLDLNNRYAAI